MFYMARDCSGWTTVCTASVITLSESAGHRCFILRRVVAGAAREGERADEQLVQAVHLEVLMLAALQDQQAGRWRHQFRAALVRARQVSIVDYEFLRNEQLSAFHRQRANNEVQEVVEEKYIYVMCRMKEFSVSCARRTRRSTAC